MGLLLEQMNTRPRNKGSKCQEEAELGGRRTLSGEEPTAAQVWKTSAPSKDNEERGGAAPSQRPRALTRRCLADHDTFM